MYPTALIINTQESVFVCVCVSDKDRDTSIYHRRSRDCRSESHLRVCSCHCHSQVLRFCTASTDGFIPSVCFILLTHKHTGSSRGIFGTFLQIRLADPQEPSRGTTFALAHRHFGFLATLTSVTYHFHLNPEEHNPAYNMVTS